MKDLIHRSLQLTCLGCAALLITSCTASARDAEDVVPEVLLKELPKAVIDGNGPGWVELTGQDFTNVNCNADTWTWKDGVLYCTGKPTGVLRTVDTYRNFEMVVEWCHRRHAGNSGVFVWTSEGSIERLTERGKPGLPKGIEVQVLDPGYEENWKNKQIRLKLQYFPYLTS